MLNDNGLDNLIWSPSGIFKRKSLYLVTVTIFKEYFIVTVTIFKKYLIVTLKKLKYSLMRHQRGQTFVYWGNQIPKGNQLPVAT